MMIRIRLTVCVTAFALMMHLSLAAGQTTAPSRVEGIVGTMDAKPVAGAKVRLFDASKSQEGYPLIESGTSDAQGHFSISAGGAKRATVAIQSPGLGLCLFNTPPGIEPLSVILQPAGTLKVRLIREDGLPAFAARAGIAYVQDAINMGATLPEQLKQEMVHLSDAAGICTYTEFPQDARVNVEVTDEQFVRTNVAAIVDDDPVALKLLPAGMIDGKITFADNGQPAPGVRVYGRVMYEVQGGRGGRTISSSFGITDAQGKYRIGQMRGGSGTISVNLEPPVSSQYVTPPSQAVTITPGQTVRAQDVSLSPGLTLRGKVTLEDGSSASRAQVSVINRTPGITATSSGVATAEDGTYIVRVLPGQYEVRATWRNPQTTVPMTSLAPGARPETITISDSATLDLQLHPQPQAQPAGQPASVVRLPGGRAPTSAPAPSPLKGTVVDEQGQPVAGVSVSIIGGGMSGGILVSSSTGVVYVDDGTGAVIAIDQASSLTTTDAAGHFEYKEIRNGATLYARKGAMGLLNRVTIGNDRDLKLVLYRDPAGGVKFQVVADDGKPLAGAIVGVQSSELAQEGTPHWLMSGPDGTFTTSGISPNANCSVTIHVHGYSTGNAGPQIQGGKQIQAPPIRLYRLDSSIAGMLVTEAGEPAANVELRTMGSRGGSKSFTTDSEGRFTVKNLPAGENINIYVSSDGRTYRLTQVPSGTQDALIVYTQQPQPTVTPARGAR